MLDFVSLSDHGKRLTKLVDYGIVRMVGMYGPTNSFLYNHETKTIAFVFGSKSDFSHPKNSAELVLALEQAAINIAGFTTPPINDVIKYARFMHGLILDCFIATCEFINQMVKLPNGIYTVNDYFLFDGFGEFYASWKSGANREQLYYVYTHLYDQNCRR